MAALESLISTETAAFYMIGGIAHIKILLDVRSRVEKLIDASDYSSKRGPRLDGSPPWPGGGGRRCGG